MTNLTATLKFDDKEAKLEWSEHRMVEFHRLLGLKRSEKWSGSNVRGDFPCTVQTDSVLAVNLRDVHVISCHCLHIQESNLEVLLQKAFGEIWVPRKHGDLPLGHGDP